MRPILSLTVCLLSGCSFLLDDNANQCQTDDDCASFGVHPYCKNGVCVPSGLGPAGCYFGAPSTNDQFINACTTAQCEPFDNCARLGLCGADAGEPPIMPPPDGGAPPAPGTTPPTPTVNCRDVAPNAIYVTGSTNLPPLLKSVAPLLAQNSPPYQVVFFSQSSCAGADSMFSSDPNKHLIKDVPPMGNTPANWAVLFNPDGSTATCFLDPAGTPVDVGESDVYASGCNPAYVPDNNVAGYLGPILTIALVVPSVSSQKVISAEAARAVFGAGGEGGMLAPWTDPKLYFVRSSSTGTNQLVSRAIDIPPKQWWGIDRRTADNLRNLMQGVDPAAAEQAIGTLSTDFADKARDNLRMLYFQGKGQSCGYLPDSTLNKREKANVRDGHYPIWGPIHFYAQISDGVPSPAAGALVTRFTVPRPDPALLDAIIDAGFVPACAMKVQRTTEVGPLMPYDPPYQCGCYFDYRTNGASSCQTCNGPNDCPASAPACNNGFCEKQ